MSDALWVRFADATTTGFGMLQGAAIHVFAGDMFASPDATGAAVPLARVRLLAPVTPRNFIGLWNNFHELATKQGHAIPETPLYFLKAPTSVIGPDDEIRPPAGYDGRTLYEGELGIVIGRPCRDVDEPTAAAAIFGYTCVNDVTAVDLLTADPSFPQWARAKSCDTFGPVGPAIATTPDLGAARVVVRLNGRERQAYPIADMILPPARIVSLISREMTLHPGDLIACGTSIGALPMRPGMTVEVEIGGIGVLRNVMAGAPTR